MQKNNSLGIWQYFAMFLILFQTHHFQEVHESGLVCNSTSGVSRHIKDSPNSEDSVILHIVILKLILSLNLHHQLRN